MVKARTSQNGPTRMLSYENKTGFFLRFCSKPITSRDTTSWNLTEIVELFL